MSEIDSIQPRLQSKQAEALATKANLPVITDLMQLGSLQLLNNGKLIAKAKEKHIALLASGQLLCADPFAMDVRTIKTMAERAGFACKIFVTTGDIIDAVFESAGDQIAALAENDSDPFSDTKAQRTLDEILEQGIHFGASDIHIEIRPSETYIKYRILGSIRLKSKLSVNLGTAVANVAFRVKANKDFNLKEVQQGAFNARWSGGQTRLRINYQPCSGGGDVVMRYLSVGDEQEAPPLSKLGFDPLHQEILETNLRKGDGIILIAGPTGSGKTTALASLLNEVPDDRKIYTIEDPVEKIIPNASQINVSGNADDSEDLSEKYTLYQKNILRQDPDDIMIGEVRDLSVAETALHVATTGHMALATIHTNGALPIIIRLHDIGISWEKLSSPGLLRALSYQRLTPCLCENCKISFSAMPTDHPYNNNRKLLSAKLRIDDYMRDFMQHCKQQNIHCAPYVINPQGCSQCDGGFNGRTVLAEVINIDRAVRRYIHEGDMLGLEEYLHKMGWENITDHAMHLVRQGLVDPYFVDSIVGPIGADDEENSFDYNAQRRKLSDRVADQPAVKESA